jgi:hypothetical protein
MDVEPRFLGHGNGVSTKTKCSELHCFDFDQQEWFGSGAHLDIASEQRFEIMTGR